jgi:hypothetical protein
MDNISLRERFEKDNEDFKSLFHVKIACDGVSRIVSMTKNETERLKNGEILYLQIGHPGLSQDRFWYDIKPEFNPSKNNTIRPLSIVRIKKELFKEFEKVYFKYEEYMKFFNSEFIFQGFLAQNPDNCIVQIIESGELVFIHKKFLEEIPENEL